MKILSLNIEGYKNLQDKSLVNFDFTNCSNYVSLIGLNGSGKSNILEAISLIFSSLFHNSKLTFKYEIVYEISGHRINVIDGKMNFVGNNNRVPKSEVFKYLPTNVISSYSGEELRMWEEIYLDSYSAFFQDIKSQSSFIPKLLYINKYSWEFALISLLCSDNKTIQAFIKDVLKIADNVDIKFTIEENNYGLYEKNEALSLIKRIVELQNESSSKSIHINTLKTLDLGQKDNEDFTKKLFYYLFITGMPVKGEKIKADKIIKKINIKFNGIDIKKLSEGEKKLILIHTITNLLADDKTLILLDEPDAHIHIERKKEIVDIIDRDGNFTVFTTHSPTILNYIKNENIRIIRDTKNNSSEVIFLDKINALSEITNNEYSIIDATLAFSTNKDILLVEGTNDYNYILHAIKMLSPDYDNYNFHIINCGGADNVPAVLEQSLLSIIRDEQLCLCTFDYDTQGRNNYTKVQEIASKSKKQNIKAMFHSKLDGTKHVNSDDFYMEDYFPVDTYRNIILNDISRKNLFKHLEQYQKPKSIIEKNYKNFDKQKYVSFKILLNETIKIQNEFHNPHLKSNPIPKKTKA